MADPWLEMLAGTPNEDLYREFVALEGLNSGVPTRTTSTLTPTTLRNIEQAILEYQPQDSHHSAGFVPPVVQNMNVVNNHTMTSGGGGTLYVNPEHKQQQWQVSAPSSPALSCSPAPSAAAQEATKGKRKVGGRRPVKDDKCTPEEEERRRIRRERNKLAAARCRKRRQDQTNDLLEETEGLEKKKQALHSELELLQREKEELEFLLEAHRPTCTLHHARQAHSQNEALKRPPPKLNPAPRPRPSTLDVAPMFRPNDCLSGSLGTPSAGLNFDSLMAGGTGLTPVATCATQTRDMGSPDASGGGSHHKLVAL